MYATAIVARHRITWQGTSATPAHRMEVIVVLPDGMKQASRERLGSDPPVRDYSRKFQANLPSTSPGGR